MASLHRDPRGKSPFWYCAYTEGDGKRRFKSTKQTNRKKAEAVCEGWQRAADLARKGLLTQVQAQKIISEIYERSSGEPLNSADRRATCVTGLRPRNSQQHPARPGDTKM